MSGGSGGGSLDRRLTRALDPRRNFKNQLEPALKDPLLKESSTRRLATAAGQGSLGQEVFRNTYSDAGKEITDDSKQKIIETDIRIGRENLPTDPDHKSLSIKEAAFRESQRLKKRRGAATTARRGTRTGSSSSGTQVTLG